MAGIIYWDDSDKIIKADSGSRRPETMRFGLLVKRLSSGISSEKLRVGAGDGVGIEVGFRETVLTPVCLRLRLASQMP